MSELNFNELPPEVLMKVFRLLDGSSLKKASLTCKLWNNLIESACGRWSLQLNYERSDPSEQKMDFVLTTNRKFGTIEIRHYQFGGDIQTLKIFQRHGFSVMNLYLWNFRIDNLVSFAKLLNLTPNLRQAHIKFLNVDDVSAVPLDQVLPDLKKLKNLELYVSNYQMIKCFQKAKLTRIKIGEMDRWEHFDALVDFLSSQETLTSLTADSYASSRRSILIEMGKLNVPIPFRLTQLEISYIRDSDELLKFVKSQAENLKELTIGRSIQESVYECVFSSMAKLNSLSLEIDEIPRGNKFFEQLKENCSVRTIKFKDCAQRGENPFFANFLKKLPSVRNLFLSYIHSNNYTSVMGQNLSDLEWLYLDSVNQHSIGLVRFSNITTLHIKDLYCRVNWDEFTKIHSRLAVITIARIEKESFLTSDFDQITNNVDLHTIRLGVGFVADDRFFGIIRTKCTNLKELLLHKSCLPGGQRQNMDINVLRLFG